MNDIVLRPIQLANDIEQKKKIDLKQSFSTKVKKKKKGPLGKSMRRHSTPNLPLQLLSGYSKVNERTHSFSLNNEGQEIDVNLESMNTPGDLVKENTQENTWTFSFSGMIAHLKRFFSNIPEDCVAAPFLDRLPESIMHIIFQYLDCRSLERVFCVNKSIRNLLYDDNIWKMKCLARWGPMEILSYNSGEIILRVRSWKEVYKRMNSGERFWELLRANVVVPQFSPTTNSLDFLDWASKNGLTCQSSINSMWYQSSHYFARFNPFGILVRSLREVETKSDSEITKRVHCKPRHSKPLLMRSNPIPQSNASHDGISQMSQNCQNKCIAQSFELSGKSGTKSARKRRHKRRSTPIEPKEVKPNSLSLTHAYTPMGILGAHYI